MATTTRPRALPWLTIGSLILWAGLLMLAVLLWGCAGHVAKRDTPRPGFGEWRHSDGHRTKLDGTPLSLMGKRLRFVMDLPRTEKA